MRGEDVRQGAAWRGKSPVTEPEAPMPPRLRSFPTYQENNNSPVDSASSTSLLPKPVRTSP
jgi:hypothetical protein